MEIQQAKEKKKAQETLQVICYLFVWNKILFVFLSKIYWHQRPMFRNKISVSYIETRLVRPFLYNLDNNVKIVQLLKHVNGFKNW
jgi:hypothetical protein